MQKHPVLDRPTRRAEPLRRAACAGAPGERAQTRAVPNDRGALPRRTFLKQSAVATTAALITAAALPGLGLSACAAAPDAYTGALSAQSALPHWKGNLMEDLPELIRCASLAPNGHNAQPWKFSIQAQRLLVQPDFSRRLAVVDPADRELYISLGAALENLLTAAAQQGSVAAVDWFPADAPDGVALTLTPDPAAAAQQGSAAAGLYDAIFTRQSTRRDFTDQAVSEADLRTLADLSVGTGVRLRLYTQTEDIEALAGWVEQGDLQQYADDAFVDELIHWLRFNEKEALRSKDGLYSKCTGNPAAPRWIGQLFLRSASPQSTAKTDANRTRHSAGLALFVSDADERSAWMQTGQLYERFALTATALGLKNSFMNQPIEVADLREQMAQQLGLQGAYPQLLVRFGYAEAMPRSLRRPVDEIYAE